MKSNDLRTDEIVASSDIGGDLEEDLATVAVHVVNTPDLRRAEKVRSGHSPTQYSTQPTSGSGRSG
jgi:hypothetical protein